MMKKQSSYLKDLIDSSIGAIVPQVYDYFHNLVTRFPMKLFQTCVCVRVCVLPNFSCSYAYNNNEQLYSHVFIIIIITIFLLI